MSRLISSPNQGVHAALMGLLQSTIAQTAGNYSTESARVIASLESADASALASAKRAHTEFKTTLVQGIQTEAGLEAYRDLAERTPALEAAAIVLAASQQPATYRNAAKAAMSVTPADANGQALQVFGHSSALGLEAFDNRPLDTSVDVSVAYQLLATRQDEFSETLFHTLVLTPDQAMYKATVERTFVTIGAKHELNGQALDLKKTNVLEAYRNPDVLRNDSTKLVPHVTDDNDSYFVPNSDIAHETVMVDGYEVVTAPISATAVNYSLIGLTSHPGLIAGGLFNQNDAIDPSIRLDYLYLKLTGTVSGTATTEYVKVKVKNSPTAQWIKTMEGGGKLARLGFRSKGVRLSAATKTVAGATSALLAGLQGVSGHLNLGITIDSDLRLDRGDISHFSARPVEKVSVLTEDGQTLPGTAPAVNGLTITVHGFTVDGRRTNSALRTRGLLADSDLWQEVYTVGLLPPFTVQRPRGEVGTKDVDTLVTLTHIAINNGAVTKLLEYNETVRDYFIDNVNNTSTADWVTGGDIEGIARMLITPYHDVITINLPEVLNNITSADKLADVRNHFVNVMTEAGYRMVQRTGYRPALEMLSGASNRKIQLTAATDVVLPQYIMIQGDDRTVGPVLDLNVVSSADIRMLGKIFMVFTTQSKEFDPLHFGNLLWVPELISKTDVSREGQHITETTVHPRWRHINNVPAMIEITVEGLTDVMQKRTSLAVNSTLMNPQDLPTVMVPETP